MPSLTADETKTLIDSIKAIWLAMPTLRDLAYRRATVASPNAVRAQTAIVTATTPLRMDAAQLLDDAENLIRDAAMHAGMTSAKTRGIPLGTCIRFLLANLDILATRCDETHGDPADWLADFTTMRHRIDRMLTPPEERIAYGSCPICENTVYGPAGGEIGVCTHCRASVPRSLIRTGVIDRIKASNVTGTARELSDLLKEIGYRVPAATIRTWAHRGRLSPNDGGLYSLADVMELARRMSDWGL